MLNLRLKPVITRLFPHLYSNLQVTSLRTGQDGTTFLPRLGSTDFVRVITLRTRTAEGRLVKTHMTPEQAYDLGHALMRAAGEAGAASIRDGGKGFAVNHDKPRDGWKTATIVGDQANEW